MKNFWKKIFAGAMLTTMVAGFSGCKDKTDNNISVDLDGDGTIAEWETVFEAAEASDRLVNKKTVVNIASLADLKAINGKAVDTAYVLTKNIDCGGETLSINIGASNYLYGNNRIIRNFKLGEAKMSETADEGVIDNGIRDYLNGSAQVSVNCLFYNAGAIYDLRLFMGKQSFAPKNDTTSMDVSAINSARFVDNVIIKGAINVKPNIDDAIKKYNLALAVVDHSEEKIEITNVETQGKISYEDGDANRVNSDGLQIAAIIPTLTAGSTVYNATAKTDISINSNAKMTVGGITATNNGFVTSSTSSGDMSLVYKESSNLVCGGIVGANEQLAEVKNCSSSGKINFTSNRDFEVNDTLRTQARVGGVAGKNTAGVIDYCVSDAEMIGNNLTTLYIGGVCGESSRGIFNNLVSRGSITLTNIDGLTMANLVGKMTYGTVEKAIVLTNISLDNSAHNFSKVRLGMVTVFEEGSTTSFTEQSQEEGGEDIVTHFYDMAVGEQKAPEFGYILVGGTNEVYMKTESEGKNTFEYNLGLRNKMLYKTEDEFGAESLASYIPHMQMFHSLYYLTNYQVKKYEPVDGVKTDMNIPLSYPVNAGSDRVRVVADSIVYNPEWFAKTLCFNYGANHNEIYVGGVNVQDRDNSLKTIKLTLNADYAKTRYFENSQYNEELSRFDSKFETVATENSGSYNTNDELFSFLNYLMGTTLSSIENQGQAGGRYMSVLVNRAFFAGQVMVEGDEGAEVVEMYAVPLFADRVAKALTQMNCVVETKYFALGGMECSSENEDLFRVRISASSGRSSFVFSFDVREFVNKTPVTDELGENYYVINIKYMKNTSTIV